MDLSAATVVGPVIARCNMSITATQFASPGAIAVIGNVFR